jgi:hypothetical protein
MDGASAPNLTEPDPLADGLRPKENMGSVIFGFELLVKKHKIFFPFLQLDSENGNDNAAEGDYRSRLKSDGIAPLFRYLVS